MYACIVRGKVHLPGGVLRRHKACTCFFMVQINAHAVSAACNNVVAQWAAHSLSA